MKCVVCNGNDIKIQDVKVEIKNGLDILYLPIKAPVCQSCGERYYDIPTMRLSEQTRKDLRENRLQVQQVGRVLEKIA